MPTYPAIRKTTESLNKKVAFFYNSRTIATVYPSVVKKMIVGATAGATSDEFPTVYGYL